VWYQPDVDDLAFEDANSLASLQGVWFAPLVVLLLLVGVAAALWRGRRMGPVVVERLPVEVRSSETMEGRARLYERGGSRDHALATLRGATLARLARTLGLGRTATPEEIIAATAATAGRDPAELVALPRTQPARDPGGDHRGDRGDRRTRPGGAGGPPAHRTRLRRPGIRADLRRAAAARAGARPRGATELTEQQKRMDAMTTTSELRDALSRVRL